MRWAIARYLPVALFSLKHGEATSTGGKGLLVPTPFAIRMALLDAAIRIRGQDWGPRAFEHIRALRLALRPPRRVAVTGLFTKVLKPEREGGRERALQRTIAFREYVYLEGALEVALGGDPAHLAEVLPLLPHVTYFGKRGSFFQFLPPIREAEMPGEEPPEGFTPMVALEIHAGSSFLLGLLQRVDEWGPGLTFEKANIYTRADIRVPNDRARFDVILPYRLVRSGRGFAVYERVEG